MSLRYKLVIAAFLLTILGSLIWSASHYHGKYQEERLRADAAEQSASAAEFVTANVIQSVSIINAISEANQHAKNQIALDSQSAQKDIRVAVAGDNCADRPVPAAAVKRLHDYADSLRQSSGGAATGKPDI